MTVAKLVSKTTIDDIYLEQLIDENPPENETDLLFFNNMKSNPEQLMIFIARVSSPNQLNPSYEKLLKYCWDHGHFSVFEQVTCTFEVETDLNVATQLLRHRSFTFQQFSRRYNSATPEFISLAPRLQDTKNRQNSIETNDDELDAWFAMAQHNVHLNCMRYYEEAIEKGIAKEVARYLLPTSTKTKLYVTGNLRSFLHYCQVRCKVDTQKEHRDLAIAIQKQLCYNFPTTSKALGWKL